MKILTLILFLLFSVSHSQTQIVPISWQKADHKTVHFSDHDPMPYVHLKGAGKVIVFLHGFSGNAHNAMDMADSLNKMGYDIWSFTWTANRDRNVEDTGTETVSEIISFVRMKTNKKLILIGHSLGGIISKIYIQGYRKNSNGIWNKKTKVLKSIKESLAAFISISSPNIMPISVDPSILFPKFLTPSLYYPLTADLSKKIKRKKLKRDLKLVRALKHPIKIVKNSALSSFLHGFFYLKLYDENTYDLNKLLRYGISSVSRKINSQFHDWSGKREFRSSNNQLSFSDLFYDDPMPIPVAYIVGDHDIIARKETIEDEARAQKAPLYIQSLSGHLDPIIGKRAKQLVPFIHHFIEAQ